MRAFAGIGSAFAAALAAVVLAAGAAGAPRTTEPVRLVPVSVTLEAKRARLDHKAVGFESVVQFRIRNRTGSARTFAIGGQRVTVRARGYRVLLLQFELRGSYPYVSTGGGTTYRGVFRVV